MTVRGWRGSRRLCGGSEWRLGWFAHELITGGGTGSPQHLLLAMGRREYYLFGMTKDLQVISVKLPLSDVRRIRGNRSEFVRKAVTEKLAREAAPPWEPKTATGRKLLRLRKQFLAEGGELLDNEGIAAELRERRGGIA